MKFYVSWTNRDPIYHQYDPLAAVLISPLGVPKAWSVKEWATLPSSLFIDSGAYSQNTTLPTIEYILHRQSSIAKGWESPQKAFFAHPDVLLPHGGSFLEKNKRVEASLSRAAFYFDLIKKKKVRATPVAVLHGFDEETLIGSYEVLRSIGYKHFALGSLATRFNRNKKLCLYIIKLSVEYGIKPLHLFGVSWPMQKESNTIRIDSFDSSSPAKLGFYGTVLYGLPLKRYVIAPTSMQKQHDNFFKFRSSIDEPLFCPCPVCAENPKRLMQKSGTQAKLDRALHNYFQIKWATAEPTNN